MKVKKILRIDIVEADFPLELEQSLEELIRTDFKDNEILKNKSFNIELQGQPFRDPQDGGFCQMVVFYEYVEI
jgi:hypothetical protein